MRDLESFKKYISNFDMNDKEILLKYNHSISVMKLCEQIAKKQNLTKKDIKLSKQIGLLHDIGRFEQLKQFNDYSDNNMDHGNYGSKILFFDNLIQDFDIDPVDYNIVMKSILNHNKIIIEKDLDKRTLYFCQLIRDCDKIDIISKIICGEIPLLSNNEKISKNIKKDFIQKLPINKNDVKNANDDVILILSFFYNIYYHESYQYIIDNFLLYKLRNKIDNEKFYSYFKILDNYLRTEEKNVRKKI